MDAVEAPVLANMPLAGGVAVIAGAYKGDTMAFLAEHHPDLAIFAFEPQLWAVDKIRERNIPNVRTFPYGLGIDNRRDAMLYEHDTDAASFINIPGARTFGIVELKDARGVFGFLGLTSIDLFLMNIEGYEYQLLPYLIEYGLPVKRWVVQFHHIGKYDEEFAACLGALNGAGFVGTPLGKGWEYWSCV